MMGFPCVWLAFVALVKRTNYHGSIFAWLLLPHMFYQYKGTCSINDPSKRFAASWFQPQITNFLLECCLNPLSWNLNSSHNDKATSLFPFSLRDFTFTFQTSQSSLCITEPRRINDRMRPWTRCSWNSSMLLMTSQITNSWRAPVGAMASREVWWKSVWETTWQWVL